jgi:hypothetical protein
MQEEKTTRLMKQINWNKSLLFAIVLFALIGLGLYLKNVGNPFQANSMPKESGALSQISQADLEEQYGLRVRLVAVTAGGGMVDVRLKIIDAEKAKTLLQNPENFPALWIADSDITLVIPDETQSQEIKFEKDRIIFILFPNAHGAVKPGIPVSLVFGNIRSEPIVAK